VVFFHPGEAILILEYWGVGLLGGMGEEKGELSINN
jgi:hypothetical protein